MNSKKIIFSIFTTVFLLTSCEDNTETVDNTTLPPSAQAFCS